MTIKQMEWRLCSMAPDHEVSECGDLRRRASSTRSCQRINGVINADGYLAYSIELHQGRKSITAHRLVIEAFHGPAPSDAHEVAHNDGSRVNNHYSNLRWATRKQNHDDTRIHKTGAAGMRNGRATITPDDVIEIRHRYREIKTLRLKGQLQSLTDKYGLCRAQIIRIAKGDSWQCVPHENQDILTLRGQPQ